MGPAVDLDLQVVLVGPHVGRRFEGGGAPGSGQDVAGDGRALLGGVRTVLDPPGLTGAGMRPAGDVTRRPHPGAGIQRGVALHPVTDRNATAGEPLGIGPSADADQDGLRGHGAAIGETHPARPPAVGENPIDADPGLDPHAVLVVDGAQQGAQFVAEGVAHGLGGVGDEGDLAAQAAGHGGGLGPDEAAADHDQMRPLREVLAQPERVLQGAQDVHPAH